MGTYIICNNLTIMGWTHKMATDNEWCGDHSGKITQAALYTIDETKCRTIWVGDDYEHDPATIEAGGITGDTESVLPTEVTCQP